MELYLQDLEQKSIHIFREAKSKFKNIAILWSGGKDSTVNLYLCQKAFFGKIPFPLIHIESKGNFEGIYQFRKKIIESWQVNFFIIKMDEYDNVINQFRKLIDKYAFDAFIISLRGDELMIKTSKKYFFIFKKEQEIIPKQKISKIWNYISGLRNINLIYPLFNWKEIDTWMYIKYKNIPIDHLSLVKNGKRYQNIDEIITELMLKENIKKDDINRDEEQTIIGKLKNLGYM